MSVLLLVADALAVLKVVVIAVFIVVSNVVSVFLLVSVALVVPYVDIIAVSIVVSNIVVVD